MRLEVMTGAMNTAEQTPQGVHAHTGVWQVSAAGILKTVKSTI
jgi:hypothetical protein